MTFTICYVFSNEQRTLIVLVEIQVYAVLWKILISLIEDKRTCWIDAKNRANRTVVYFSVCLNDSIIDRPHLVNAYEFRLPESHGKCEIEDHLLVHHINMFLVMTLGT